jgi:hypothetical protein
MPNARRASIAPEASVQFAFWNGPPSNWLTSGTRGKPSGVVRAAGGVEERVRGGGEVATGHRGRTTAVWRRVDQVERGDGAGVDGVSLKSGASPAVGTSWGRFAAEATTYAIDPPTTIATTKTRAWAGGATACS